MCQSISRWIPVEERLPEGKGEVLVTSTNEMVGMDFFKDGKWLWSEGEEWQVVAWMPLPEPYKVVSLK